MKWMTGKPIVAGVFLGMGIAGTLIVGGFVLARAYLDGGTDLQRTVRKPPSDLSQPSAPKQ